MPIGFLSFERALYADAESPVVACAWCGRGLRESYFLVAGEKVCTVCGERAASVRQLDSRDRFIRAAGAGSAVAIAGSAACLAVARFGSSIGYGMGITAVAVGFAVGKVMKRMAPPVRGRRYQIAAAVLVYAAVVVAMSAALLGLDGVPAWAYPFLLLTPFANLFLGKATLGLMELFVAAIAVRWASVMLRPVRVDLTGPWPVERADREQQQVRSEPRARTAVS